MWCCYQLLSHGGKPTVRGKPQFILFRLNYAFKKEKCRKPTYVLQSFSSVATQFLLWWILIPGIGNQEVNYQIWSFLGLKIFICEWCLGFPICCLEAAPIL